MDTYHFPPMNAASLPPARDLGESDRSQHHPVADLVHQLGSRATSTRENKGSLTTKCLFNRGLQIPIFHICTSFEGVLIPKTNFCVDFTELTGLSFIRIPASKWTPRGLFYSTNYSTTNIKGERISVSRLQTNSRWVHLSIGAIKCLTL